MSLLLFLFDIDWHSYVFPRLIDNAPHYFDVASFPDGETKRALQRVLNKRAGKSMRNDDDGTREKKKRKKQ